MSNKPFLTSFDLVEVGECTEQNALKCPRIIIFLLQNDTEMVNLRSVRNTEQEEVTSSTKENTHQFMQYQKNHDIHYYGKNEQEEVTASTKENTHQFMKYQKNYDIHY